MAFKIYLDCEKADLWGEKNKTKLEKRSFSFKIIKYIYLIFFRDSSQSWVYEPWGLISIIYHCISNFLNGICL